jgi:hypothetical protein
MCKAPTRCAGVGAFVCLETVLAVTPMWCHSGAMKRFGIRMPPDLHRECVEAAEAEQRSLNKWLLMAARHYLNHTRKINPTLREKQ